MCGIADLRTGKARIAKAETNKCFSTVSDRLEQEEIQDAHNLFCLTSKLVVIPTSLTIYPWNRTLEFAEKLKFFLQTQGYGFE